MSEIVNFHDLFYFNLQRAYDAEKRIVEALPAMREASSSSELKHVFQTHLEETHLHIDRLLQVFEWLDKKAKSDTCHAVQGLVKDASYAVLLDLVGVDAPVKDAALIAAAQQVEHFEIAMYGTLRSWAVALEKPEVMEGLELTVEEEKNADTVLSAIAGTLNLRAAHTA
jgi:ferritin-like metal-binding protein YciE